MKVVSAFRLRPPRYGLLKVRCEVKGNSRVANLRSALAKPGLLLGPCCHDGLSAKLIERAEFPFAFMSGFTTAAARLGAPDVGLLTYTEMVETGRNIFEATKSLPIIGDADTGYGNVVNVGRTVHGYTNSGFAGILIEDQVWPKSCGHLKGKRVVPRQEAIERIAAAVAVRNSGDDIVIVARTDAKQAESFDEALFRVEAFVEAGADIVFIDALETIEEMERFCFLFPNVHKMANMLEGGGRTPILPPEQLEQMGFKLSAYPLSLLGVSISAMEEALEQLRIGQVPKLSFEEIQKVVGFEEYFGEVDGYKEVAREIMDRQPVHYSTSNGGTQSKESTTAEREDEPGAETEEVKRSVISEEYATPHDGADDRLSDTVQVEADEVIAPEDGRGTRAGVPVTVESVESESEGDKRKKKYPSFALIRVTSLKRGETKMEFKVPLGLLNDIDKYVPAFRNVDPFSFLNGEGFIEGEPVFSFTDNDDLVQVFLE